MESLPVNNVLILLGGNLPATRDLFASAEVHINQQAGLTVGSSSLYKSTPWGFATENLFLNKVLEIETGLNPHDLLTVLLEIEAGLGRERSEAGGYDSRGIDIDILFYGSEVISSPRLTIPHPRLHLRRFTLLPLNECWPGWVHPLEGKPVHILLAECSDTGTAWRVD